MRSIRKEHLLQLVAPMSFFGDGQDSQNKKLISFRFITQLTLTYSKSTTETLEKGVKYFQS